MTGPPPPPEAVTAHRDDLERWLADHRDELVAFRRHLHAHPELSGEEHETTQAVASRLHQAGLAPRVLPAGTGLVCDLAGAEPGTEPARADRPYVALRADRPYVALRADRPYVALRADRPYVALRADLDALAMDDGKDVPYRSTRPGVTHACGHDVHTTVVLGAGLALADLVPGVPVRLLFQPAEERLPGGAVEVIAAGGLDGVAEVYGVHCDPRLRAGQVGLVAGPVTSATDAISITLRGPGGHTARPERSVDLVHLTGLVATQLPERVTDLLEGRTARITFGSVHAGDAPNVIPSTAVLAGTARTPDVAVWDALDGVLRAALAEVVDPHGATWELTHTRGHPPVVNDPVATAHMVDAGRVLLGEDAVRPTRQSVGGDDFSWYLDRVPGCYARLGVADADTGAAPADLHAHAFDVDERCIDSGIRLLVGTVLTSLSHRAQEGAAP